MGSPDIDPGQRCCRRRGLACFTDAWFYQKTGGHPMQPVLAIEEQDNSVIVSLTDTHLTRASDDALQRACDGKLDYVYVGKETASGVSWTR